MESQKRIPKFRREERREERGEERGGRREGRREEGGEVSQKRIPKFHSLLIECLLTNVRYGTEDPRVGLLPNGTYLLFYTQYPIE
jgi:hypothetical protein